MEGTTQSLATVILTRAQCSVCEQTKALLTRLATEYPLVVTVLDVEDPEGQVLAGRWSIPFAPAVLLGDEAFGYGRISERALRKEIERRVGRVGAPRPPELDHGHRGRSGLAGHARSLMGWLARTRGRLARGLR